MSTLAAPAASHALAALPPRAARFGVFGVGPHLVGLPVAHVEEMFVLPQTHRPPDAPPHHRGLANLRGTALPAIDLRVCLGLESASVELDSLLALLCEREQDHVNWLADLEASVREDREFVLATDPRECKFGKWYYAFQTGDAVLRGELAKIEKPHTEIHALAAQVGVLKAGGKQKEALERLERARNGLLQELLRMCKSIQRAVREQQREIGVTTLLRGQRTVLVVDRAEAVADLEQFADADDPLVSGQLEADLVQRLARWGGAKAPVMLLDLERIASL
jgi:chemotaxis signal transduction protein